jgi:hypothetical protein
MPIRPSRKKASRSRSARFDLPASKEQETVLRLAAQASNKSLTEFILDSACAAVEQTLLDQRIGRMGGSVLFGLRISHIVHPGGAIDPFTEGSAEKPGVS